MRKFISGSLLLLLFGGPLIRAQSYDVADSTPPKQHGLNDGNVFRPLKPKPFETCRIIINNNPASGRLTFETMLKNLGYKSNITSTDSAIIVTIDPVAEGIAGHNAAPVLIPNKFELYVIIDNHDTARYYIEYLKEKDRLDITSDCRLKSNRITIEPTKRTSELLWWVLLDGHDIPDQFKNEIDRVAEMQSLDDGYYWGLPYHVQNKKIRNGSYNHIDNRRIVFLKPFDISSFEPALNQILRQYRSSGKNISAGCLKPLPTEPVMSEK
jgi:hypothetical protein